METAERYRQIVRKVIAEYTGKPSHGDINSELVIDKDQNHFEVMQVGWHEDERVHGTVVHVDIINGKVWIQYDGTDRPIADELVQAGIPREDIVLAFHPADVRKYTEFAVG